MTFQKKIEKTIAFFESKEVDRLEKLVRFVTRKLEKSLAEAQIPARVSSRVKSSQSVQAKLEKWADTPAKKAKLDLEPQEILQEMNDLAAARVMTYTEKDRDAVAELVTKLFACPGGYRTPYDLERKEDHPRIKLNDQNHYRATHMMLAVDQRDLVREFSNLRDDKCELQITSLLAHVWNEIEHDIIYKNSDAELSDAEYEAIKSLGNLTETGDSIIKSLLRASKAREDKQKFDLNEKSECFESAEELSGFLQKHFGPKIDARKMDYTSGASELLACMRAVNWVHPRDVASQFAPSVLQAARKETLRLGRFLKKEGRTRPSLDPDTCDLFIIATMMQKYETLLHTMSEVHPNKHEKAILLVFEQAGL